MTSEELIALMNAVPFVPFALCTDLGDFSVPTVGRIAHAPGACRAAVAAEDGTIEIVELSAAYAESLAEIERQDADDRAATADGREQVRRGEYVPWDQVRTELGL
jgi:hypothetical protein